MFLVNQYKLNSKCHLIDINTLMSFGNFSLPPDVRLLICSRAETIEQHTLIFVS